MTALLTVLLGHRRARPETAHEVFAAFGDSLCALLRRRAAHRR